MLIMGNCNIESWGDGWHKSNGDASMETAGNGIVECVVRAGEPKHVEGSDGWSICNNVEPDQDIPGTSVAPDHADPYGEKNCDFFGDSMASICTCCCTSVGWFEHIATV